LQANNACLAEANRVMNNIKERGLIRSRYTLPVPIGSTFATAMTVSGTQPTAATENGLTVGQRWMTGEEIYGPLADPQILRPYVEIMGYMNFLQALYNNNKSAFCPNSGPGNVDSASDPVNTGVSDSSNLANAHSYLKVQPFDTTTGTVVACNAAGANAPIHIRPPHDASSAYSTTIPVSDTTTVGNLPLIRTTGTQANYPNGTKSMFAADSVVTDTKGWAVTVTVNYEDRKHTSQSCSIQEKFQYSTQPANLSKFEFQDIEGADPSAAQSDTATPENLNGTVRMHWLSADPIYPATDPLTGGVHPTADYSQSTTLPSDPSADPTNTLFYGCASSDYNRSVNLRLKNVRPGSIMMCRNLSSMRDLPTQAAGVEHAYFPFAQRTTFYSTELLQNAYFAAQDNADSIAGDMMIFGLYYPASAAPGGDYYCYSAEGCSNLPRFSYGFDGSYLPAGQPATHTWTDPSNPSIAHYYPRTTPAAAAASTTGWVPCETINVCGVTPTYAGFVPGFRTDAATANDFDAYHLQINNLPVGCEVDIQMNEVDAGYNAKATEFKEYIHEKIPGDKLCRNGDASHLLNPVSGGPTHGAHEWFFACSSKTQYQDLTYGAGLSVPKCTSGNDTTPCCLDFPFYPSPNNSNYDPP